MADHDDRAVYDQGEGNGSIALDSLVPDPRNARRHTDRNLATITAALREVGAARSVVVDEAGVVLAGNATVEAAARAGLTRVRVIDADGTELVAVRRTGLSPEQKRRLALFDNRAGELAEWDTETLASLAEELDLSTLWEPDELADLLGDDPEPVPLPGDLWFLGDHRLLCGDSTEGEDVARLMAGTRSPLMPTDPPYLVNYQGGNHPQSWHNRAEVKDKHWDDYREGDGAALFTDFLRVALAEALTPNPALYQFHASSRQALVEAAWQANGLLLHQQLIWVKNRPVLTHSHYLWQHEPCFYGWVQGKPPARKPPTTATTVWTVDRPDAPTGESSGEPTGEDHGEPAGEPAGEAPGTGHGLHPTQKPVALIRRMVESHTLPGETVYEPFAGSGTALIACELLGRRCYGLELAPAFCDVIVGRWETLTGQTARREGAT